MSIIKDPSLASAGKKKIEWVRDFMPVLSRIEEESLQTRPLDGVKVAISCHLEAKTAYLCHVMRSMGAEVHATGCNPLSTKDEIAAALDADGFDVYGFFGATPEEYESHLLGVLACRPNIIIDDGGDLVNLLHGEHSDLASEIIGGCEETTTGIKRLQARAKANALNFPMMAVNDAKCKHLFDNRHGTGQSVWDSIMFTTNNMITGKTVVIAGYGYCGRGIASRAKGLGANVIVTEVDPHKGMEAAMDGFRVMKMDDAASVGDIFVTSTGCRDVIVKRHFEVMKNNAIVANAGHFDVEVNLVELKAMAVEVFERKPFITGYRLPDGRIINAMAEGRLVNITAGNGHPAEIMDLSFSIQALSAMYVAQHGRGLKPGLYDIPEDIDDRVGRMKAEAMGLGIDELSAEQQKYITSYEGV